MQKTMSIATLTLIGMLGFQSQTAAQGRDLPLTTALATGTRATAPIGWHDFCARYAGECNTATQRLETIPLTLQTWRLLTSINDKVNDAIEPVTDMDHWNLAERWDYAEDGKGDCDEYVLVKRKRLMQAGLPRQALLITVVRDKKGDGHAVLVVKTDRGDFVLDNQDNRILPWRQTGYQFVKQQSQENQNVWVRIDDSVSVPVTAAR
jgi:predicted transglutaminase-like cysteine proteinase